MMKNCRFHPVKAARVYQFPKDGGTSEKTAIDRSGSVCLNSLCLFYKWISTLIMLPPGLVASC